MAESAIKYKPNDHGSIVTFIQLAALPIRHICVLSNDRYGLCHTPDGWQSSNDGPTAIADRGVLEQYRRRSSYLLRQCGMCRTPRIHAEVART